MAVSLLNRSARTPAPKFKIRKGDTVRVLSGKEKGKTGQVLEVDARKGRILIEKVNLVKRHVKPSQKQRQGGIVEKEGPLKISKVMIVCRNCGEPSRVGLKHLEDGKRLRVCKKCGEVVDKA